MVSLEQIASSPEAVFAIDRNDRIIIWNAACERLLGYRADRVLGRPCWEVMGGRDVHGNRYCYEYCPVVHQLREVASEPLRSFTITTRHAAGGALSLSVSAHVVDGSDPSLGVIVHVLKEDGVAPSRLEHRLHRLSQASSARNVRSGQTQIDELTPREQEVLTCLAQGLPTDSIASELGIATVTVRNHVRTILQKLGVHTRFAAVAYAYQRGIV